MPFPVAAAVAAPLIAGGVSGILSFIAQSSANDRAEMLQNRALQEFLKINVPDPEEQKVVFDEFVNQGQLSPVLQQAISQDPSQFEKIVTNAKYQNSQNKALAELEEIGNSGGLRLQDKAALQESLQGQQVRDRANRQAIGAEAARKGQGGSGFEIASKLQAQQGTSDQAANNSLKIAGLAQDRALQAIEAGGNLAGKYRGQDFQEQSAKASAADRINQFNTENLRGVNAANVGLKNRALEQNLANKQDISNKNTALKNSQQVHNKGLVQQQYDNQLKRAAGATGQYNKLGETAQRGGEIAGNTISNIGGAATGAITSANNADFWSKYFDSQKKKQKSGQPDFGVEN